MHPLCRAVEVCRGDGWRSTGPCVQGSGYRLSSAVSLWSHPSYSASAALRCSPEQGQRSSHVPRTKPGVALSFLLLLSFLFSLHSCDPIFPSLSWAVLWTVGIHKKACMFLSVESGGIKGGTLLASFVFHASKEHLQAGSQAVSSSKKYYLNYWVKSGNIFRQKNRNSINVGW